MKRRAVVNSRGGRLFVTSYSATASGGTYVQDDDWVETTDEPVEDRALGKLVRSALAASRADVPYPDFSKGPLPGRRKLLKLAGAKSERQYARGTRHIAVYWEDGNSPLIVKPYRNGGPRDGFSEMPEQVISLHVGSSDAELGTAVRAALIVATEDG